MNAPPVENETDLKAGRRRVARSRGALSGVLLVVLGAWAALIPFIGPYFDVAFTPRPNDAWHWTSGRGLYELLPGGVAVLAGLLLLFSASRFLTVLFSALAAAAGAWLVVAPSLSDIVGVSTGAPDATINSNKSAILGLLFFFAIGAAIAIVAGIALGRLSTHSVRDVRAAERRHEAEAAERHRLEQDRLEQDRLEQDRLAAARAEEQRRHDDDQRHTVAPAGANTDTNLEKRHDSEQHNAGQHNADRHDQVVAGDGSGRHESDRVPDEQPTTTMPAQPSPYTPSGPRDTAGSTGYLGTRAPGADGSGSTQAYPPPQGQPRND